MNKTLRRLASLGLVAGAVLLLQLAPAEAHHEPFATYETWTTAPTIRSDRWFGGSDLGQERLREVRDDKLVMRFRREGGTGSDSGSAGFFSNRLNLVNPRSVDQMEVEFRVRDLTVTGCPANATASIARAAAIDLTRISDLPPGTLSAPGDLTGDHIARVEVRRLSDSTDSEGGLTVRAVLFRCNNPGCSLTTTIGTPAIIGQIQTRKLFRVRLIWNPDGNEFRAGLDANPDIPLPYPAASNARPANSPFALLRVQHLTANCTVASGGPAVGDAKIEVREVRTNASAVIP
jgi:hypothetical protein